MRNATSVGNILEFHCVESPYQFGICHSEYLSEASIFANIKITRRLQKIFKLIATNIMMRNATSVDDIPESRCIESPYLFRICHSKYVPNLNGKKIGCQRHPFCEYKNNKTTSENILAHCDKYYYEKWDFCWRHS